ncbi:hypothetical protein Tco_1007006 [Tanacetum coccineum]|uniref:Uncharacterized protein n=1 Tax=Tanacetum coccineum TaxID=301880 RepID=A0ABQ5FKF2_9ASTR
MTTPHPIPFPATTPRARVLISFVIISDSNDETTTLPVRPAPPSSDHTLALYGYPLDSGNDLSDEDLSETIESLHTQTAPTSVVLSPPTCPLSTSSTFARRSGKKILTSPPSLLPSSSSPPSLLLSSSSPPLSLLLSSSRKRSRSPSPSLPPSVSPSPLPLPPLPLPLPAVVPPPPPERIESVRDAIACYQAKYAKSCLERSHERQTADGALKTDMTEQDIKTLHARAEAAEQRAETLQVDRIEMAELRSRAKDIEASFLDLERHLGP